MSYYLIHNHKYSVPLREDKEDWLRYYNTLTSYLHVKLKVDRKTIAS